jgi:hypothetical protein
MHGSWPLRHMNPWCCVPPMRYCEVGRKVIGRIEHFVIYASSRRHTTLSWLVSKIAEAKKRTYYDPNERASNRRLESRVVLNPGGDLDENSLEV